MNYHEDSEMKGVIRTLVIIVTISASCQVASSSEECTKEDKCSSGSTSGASNLKYSKSK